jgi:hypothetical protein
VRRAKEGDDDNIVGRGTREMNVKSGQDELRAWGKNGIERRHG